MTVEDVKRTDQGPALMLSNEAIVRGVLEADAKVVAFYPGSPTCISQGISLLESAIFVPLLGFLNTLLYGISCLLRKVN